MCPCMHASIRWGCCCCCCWWGTVVRHRTHHQGHRSGHIIDPHAISEHTASKGARARIYVLTIHARRAVVVAAVGARHRALRGAWKPVQRAVRLRRALASDPLLLVGGVHMHRTCPATSPRACGPVRTPRTRRTHAAASEAGSRLSVPPQQHVCMQQGPGRCNAAAAADP